MITRFSLPSQDKPPHPGPNDPPDPCPDPKKEPSLPKKPK
jgi:hypothetical protein